MISKAKNSVGLMVVVFSANEKETSLKRRIANLVAEYANYVVVDPGASHGKGAIVRTAGTEARRLGMTHLLTFNADGRHELDDIMAFITAISEDPEAVFVGRRNLKTAVCARTSRFRCYLRNFMLRIQTGVRLGDAACSFRAYPLTVLQNLNLPEGPTFDMAVLVRAAWAGIELKEVSISFTATQTKDKCRPWVRWKEALAAMLLDIHFTMRSITPIPHAKLETAPASQEKITVLHPLRSIKRLLTENRSPRRIAAAGALGVFLGTLPLIALHTVVILFFATFFRLNKVAALAASQLCMPPLVPALCIEIGFFMRHGRLLTEISIETLGYQAAERLYEWLIGSLILAPVLALSAGGLIYAAAWSLNRN
jgi:uncharacterized protein (DUF2062 family)